MALNIKDPGVDALVRELARETGESITVAVEVAARERLERMRAAVPSETRARAMMQVLREADELPVLDDRPIDELIPYDENGLPI